MGTASSVARARSSTRSGRAARTIELSYRPAWHAPLLNSAESVRVQRRVSGQATDARGPRAATAARTAASCAGSRWLFTRQTCAAPMRSSASTTARRNAVSASAGTLTAPAKPAAKSVTPNGIVGATRASMPASTSRRAARSLAASLMMASVPSGRCGPCGSTEPTGWRITNGLPPRSRVSAAGEVRSARKTDIRGLSGSRPGPRAPSAPSCRPSPGRSSARRRRRRSRAGTCASRARS